MTRTAVLLLAVIAFVPARAHAQSTTGSEAGYALVLFGTLAPALLFDAMIISDLIREGTVRKGYGINALIFGGLAMSIGALMAITLLNDTRVKSGWGLAGIGVAALGAGTGVMGIYGLTHPHPIAPAEEERRPDDRPNDGPPPVPPPAPQVRWLPQLGITPHGGVMVGLTGTL